MCMCENHWRSREKVLKIGQDTAHSGKMFSFFPLYSSFIIYRQIFPGQWKIKYSVTQCQCVSRPWLWDTPLQGILEHVPSAYTCTSLPHSGPAAPQHVSWSFSSDCYSLYWISWINSIPSEWITHIYIKSLKLNKFCFPFVMGVLLIDFKRHFKLNAKCAQSFKDLIRTV